MSDQKDIEILLPLTPAKRQEKQLKDAGYEVHRKEIPEGSLFLSVPQYVPECFLMRTLVFEYDLTGYRLIRFFVTECPYEPNLDKEKILIK